MKKAQNVILFVALAYLFLCLIDETQGGCTRQWYEQCDPGKCCKKNGRPTHCSKYQANGDILTEPRCVYKSGDTLYSKLELLEDIAEW